MKNNIFIILLSLICFYAALPVYSETTGVNIGFETSYSWWMPYWSIYKSDKPSGIVTTNQFIPWDNTNKIKINPAFRTGPFIVIDLPGNFSVSSRFAYGQYTASKKEQVLADILTMDSIGYYRRYEFDILIRYSFIDYINVAAGFDYTYFSNKTLSYSTGLSNYQIGGKKVIRKISDEYTPLIGFGVAIPALKNVITIKVDAALLFCMTNDNSSEYSLGRTEFSSAISIMPPRTVKKAVKKIGTKANFSITYHVPVVPISVTIGFRYQMYNNLTVQKDKALEYEHLYGITASVDYRFNIH